MATLFVPMVAGTALLSAFLFGGKSKAAEQAEAKQELDSLEPAEKEAVKESVEALKAKDWLRAVANALRSNSPKYMRELAGELKKAGLAKEAADLLNLAKKAEAAQKPKTSPKPAPVLAKPKPIVPLSVLKPKAPTLPKPAPKPVAKADDAAKRAAALKAAEAKAAKEKAAALKAEASKLKAQAVELKAHLASTGRYKENKSYVELYQKNNGLDADGLYGPATARSFWNKYKLVPVNPFYWKSSNAAAETAAYRAFLDSIVASDKSKAAEVSKLKGTVGK